MMRPCLSCGQEMTQSEPFYKIPTGPYQRQSSHAPGYRFGKVPRDSLFHENPEMIWRIERVIIWRCDPCALTIEEKVSSD